MVCLTFEICAQYRFHIGGLYRSKGLISKEDLLQCTTSLPKVEEEQLHQSGLGVRPEDLLKSIDSQRSLILKSGSWKAAMLICDNSVLLY